MASKSQSSQFLSNLVAKVLSFFKSPPVLLNDPRKRWWVIVPCLVVLAAIGAGAYYQLAYIPAQRRITRASSSGQTSVVRRGTITLSAIGTGTLQPNNQVQ